MSRRIDILTAAALAASLLLPSAALAFNPQPDPPGKMQKLTKSLGGPDTKSKGGTGSWKAVHEVDEKSKGGTGSWKAYHDVEEKSKTKSKWKGMYEYYKSKGK